MAEIPAGAQRSPDGHYWWDEGSRVWQPVSGGDAPAGPVARSGSISIELGVIADDDHSHDEVVAMVERGGAQLPPGEAYA